MDMLRYLRSKIPAVHLTESKKKEKDDLFHFQKTVQHGFPTKPTCIAHDSQLNLLAIGTKNGFVKIYGAPGVEFVGLHSKENVAVEKIFFIPNQARLISLCDDGTFHLWEINFREGKSFLDHVKEFSTEGRLKKISCCCLKQTGDEFHLLIGTEGGNVYQLDATTFELTDHIIYQDSVIQNIPEDYKVNPGAIEALAFCPTDSAKLLIGYNRGLIVLWDAVSNSAVHTYNCGQQIEDVCWSNGGNRFVSAHNDGSTVIWNTIDSSKPDVAPNTPFGPFPCKGITKVVWNTTGSDTEDLMLFTGGMPRASYGDRHTVTAMKGGKQVVFDFESKVIDFITVKVPDVDEPVALLTLCEDELVGVDLLAEDWPVWRLPYLYPLHASPISAAQHVSDVTEAVWNKLLAAGKSQTDGKFKNSHREWPIQGGKNNTAEGEIRDLLITGHEDGTVKFWNASGVSLNLIYVLNTAKLFAGYNDPSSVVPEEDDWPAFRKVGLYDPFSDDPRCGVQRISMDSTDGTLAIGGTAGQVIIWDMIDAETELEQSVKKGAVKAVTVDVITDQTTFVWKGHDMLELRQGSIKYFPGFVPKAIMQLKPPAACTSLALKADLGVVGVGTAHGYALFDFIQKKAVVAKCTLNPNDLATVNAVNTEGTISRLKSFKKSLRESFRKRRHTRSPPPAATPVVTEEKKDEEKKTEGETAVTETPANTEATTSDTAVTDAPPTATFTPEIVTEASRSASPAAAKGKVESPKKAPQSPTLSEEPRTVERAVEARSEADALGSMVRSMHFAQTYVVNATTLSQTFWVGTNAGTVFVNVLTIPEGEKRATDAIECQLAKEVQLRHGAPVMEIMVVDAQNFCVNNRPEGIPAPTTSGHDHGHKVIICSEEQLKAFHLPTLKPIRHKYKLTANEGARLRKVAFVNFQNKSDDTKCECYIVVMTNQGDVQTFSVGNLRRQYNANCIRKDDLSAIASTVLTRRGEGFYLLSSSELQRFSISARRAVVPDCSLALPEGSRPVPEVVEEPIEKVATGDSAEPQANADTSLNTTTGNDETHNASVLPSDITIDSIRDYTNQIVETVEEHNASSKTNTTVMVTKVVKHVVTTTVNGNEETKKTEVETKEVTVNGDHMEDEIALEKMKAIKLDAENQIHNATIQ